jgi:hypothetical protein
MTTGACLCGALRYEVESNPRELTHCHCSMCRKHHGAPFATFVAAPADGVRWLEGEASVVSYRSSAARERRFCPRCGAVAPEIVGDRAWIPAGNLVGELGEVSGLHMFVGSKPPWHVIADDFPQHDKAPPGWPIEEVERPAPSAFDGALHGSCLCGSVSFSMRGGPARWFQCHCSRCRRGRSAAHASNMFFSAAQLEWRTGRELVVSYRPADAERFTVSFCSRCGGGAPIERENVPFVLVPAGILDTDPGRRPDAHIHLASKAPWYTFRDDLTQFEGLPPS